MDRKKFKFLKYLPLLVIGILSVFVFLNLDKLTVENIISYSPDNKALAGLAMLLLYGLKSLSLVFPIALLYIASGKLFSQGLAFMINMLGLVLVLLIPYFLGRRMGDDHLGLLVEKYPRLELIDRFKDQNQWYFTIIVRYLKFIPGDLASLILGSLGIALPTYLVFSILVRLPALVTMTFIGSSIRTKNRRSFIISSLMSLVIALASSLVFYLIKKRNDIKE